MALKSGLNAQLGIVAETTYGTPVTVTRFIPMISENINQKIARMESKGIIAGRRVLDATQWAAGDITIAGQVQVELYDHSMGPLLKNMFGASTIGGSGPYTNTLTPGDLTGNSLTVQIGRPDVGTGTVRPFTYTGCKVAKWSLGCQAGQIATLGVDLVGQAEIRVRTVSDGVTTGTNTVAIITSATAAFTADDVGKPISGTQIPAATTILSVTSATTAVMSANAVAAGTALAWTIGVALATASYTTMNPVSYVSGSLTLSGSVVPVKQVTINGDNMLDAGRRFIGSQLISEPLEVNQRPYTIDFLPEFTDLTLYNRFVNGVTGSLVLVLASGINTYTTTMNVRYDDGTPNVSGTKIVENPMKAYAIGTTDAAAITMVTSNVDSVI